MEESEEGFNAWESSLQNLPHQDSRSGILRMPFFKLPDYLKMELTLPLYKQQCESVERKGINLLLSVYEPFYWIPPKMSSANSGKLALLFTLRESRGYRISFVVKDSRVAGCCDAAADSFTLDAADLQHPRLLQRWG